MRSRISSALFYLFLTAETQAAAKVDHLRRLVDKIGSGTPCYNMLSGVGDDLHNAEIIADSIGEAGEEERAEMIRMISYLQSNDEYSLETDAFWKILDHVRANWETHVRRFSPFVPASTGDYSWDLEYQIAGFVLRPRIKIAQLLDTSDRRALSYATNTVIRGISLEDNPRIGSLEQLMNITGRDTLLTSLQFESPFSYTQNAHEVFREGSVTPKLVNLHMIYAFPLHYSRTSKKSPGALFKSGITNNLQSLDIDIRRSLNTRSQSPTGFAQENFDLMLTAFPPHVLPGLKRVSLEYGVHFGHNYWFNEGVLAALAVGGYQITDLVLDMGGHTIEEDINLMEAQKMTGAIAPKKFTFSKTSGVFDPNFFNLFNFSRLEELDLSRAANHSQPSVLESFFLHSKPKKIWTHIDRMTPNASVEEWNLVGVAPYRHEDLMPQKLSIAKKKYPKLTTIRFFFPTGVVHDRGDLQEQLKKVKAAYKRMGIMAVFKISNLGYPE